MGMGIGRGRGEGEGEGSGNRSILEYSTMMTVLCVSWRNERVSLNRIIVHL